jgi:haloalkane dehalogenase
MSSLNGVEMIPVTGEKRRVDVDGTGIAVVEAGEGDPIVFLHGNPTSSYLWRDVLPHLAPLGRCLAPDLAGMGDSDPLPGRAMRFVDHAAFLERLLERLDVRERVVLVLHDWGSALGFDWARRHPDAVRGIAYLEAIVAPLTPAHFADGGEFIGRIRGPEGERLVLEENVFIEGFLPSGVLRDLTPEELDVYRRPWREPGEARRQLLVWPRELPLDGEPSRRTPRTRSAPPSRRGCVSCPDHRRPRSAGPPILLAPGDTSWSSPSNACTTRR